jgi:hypothetical protein
MPQPFKTRGRIMKVTGDAVVLRPHLAISFGHICSTWSSLEYNLSLSYTYLLGGTDSSAFRFYHELIDTNLKEKAFMSAAEDKISDDLKMEASKIYIELRKIAKSRNEVIHGMWAICENKLHSIFLWKARDINDKVNIILKNVNNRIQNPNKLHDSLTVNFVPDEFVEYKHTDFDKIVERIQKLDATVTAFGLKLLSQALERMKQPKEQ